MSNEYEQMIDLGFREYFYQQTDLELKQRTGDDVDFHDKFLKELKKYVGKNLFQKEQQEIRKIFERISTQRAYGIKTLNGILDEKFLDFGYRFTNKNFNGKALKYRDEKSKNNNKHYWKMVKRET